MANVDTHEEFWGITLTKEQKSYTWDPSADSEEDVEHKIQVTQACLGHKAKPGERNLIEVTTEDDDGRKITCPIVSLTVGGKECIHLELGFNNTSKFVLREGSGPLALSGVHLQALPLDLEDGESSGSEDEEVPDLLAIKTDIKPLVVEVAEEKNMDILETDKKEEKIEKKTEEKKAEISVEKVLEIKEEEKKVDKTAEKPAEEKPTEEKPAEGKTPGKRLLEKKSDGTSAKKKKVEPVKEPVKEESDDEDDDEDDDDDDDEEEEEGVVLVEAKEDTGDEDSEDGDEEPEHADDVDSEDDEDDDDDDDDEDNLDSDDLDSDEEMNTDEDIDDEDDSEEEEEKPAKKQKNKGVNGDVKKTPKSILKDTSKQNINENKQKNTPATDNKKGNSKKENGIKTPKGKKENTSTPNTKGKKENTGTPNKGKDTTTHVKRTPEEIKSFLLKSPNLPKKFEKFANFMSNNMKVTDKKTHKELWDFVQKNKK